MPRNARYVSSKLFVTDQLFNHMNCLEFSVNFFILSEQKSQRRNTMYIGTILREMNILQQQKNAVAGN